MSAEHEFTAEQNQVIAGSVVMARVSAGALFVHGALKLVESLREGKVMNGVAVVIFSGLLGVWMIQAAAALNRVVTTEGDDVTHLVDAFRRLTVIFRGIRNVQILMLAILVLVFGVTLVAALGVLAMAASHRH